MALSSATGRQPGNPNPATFNVYYESVITQLSGTTSPTYGPNFAINGSANQFTVIAGFQER